MTRNIGTADRAIRLIAGIVLVLLPFLTSFAAATPWLWWASLVAGLVMLATAATRVCPAYSLLGVKTCPA
jgi:Kef-type K+ transport system membrane component KefB